MTREANTGLRQPEVGVAILGMGTVGTEVVRLLNENADSFTHRVGAPIVIRGIAVRDLDKDRNVDPELLTDDPQSLVDREDVDVVVEVIGGIDGPRELILSALQQGKSVVTANKALVAAHAAELSQAADDSRVDLYFEAAVAGAIPIIGPLKRSMAGDELQKVMGIVNGTTNFILSAMDETGADYEETLAEAGRLGYAEADPTADVEGYDAASKAAILSTLAFHTRVTSSDVYREGITKITQQDIQFAHKLNCTIKLLAVCERVQNPDGGEAVSARVYPALIPKSHQLATVNGAFNAVFLEASSAGQIMFYGPGAGGAPTASAVLGDLVAASRNVVHGGRAPGDNPYANLPIANFGDVETRYLVSMLVRDEKGTLSQIAKVFSEHGVSISTVQQDDYRVIGDDAEGKDFARLMVVTHRAKESDLAATVEALETSHIVASVASVLRMEGLEGI
ncbi:MAG: homoserine dehydrogenase [Lawsonella sp.]|nr:homoserine dehydrogenase [Mycobacteriales bacterium]